MIISTPRITLRDFEPADHAAFVAVALNAATCLVEHGFNTLHLLIIVGDTGSGNRRVEKLARWFGARIIDRRDGPEWMRARGWQEVDWALTRDEWQPSRYR